MAEIKFRPLQSRVLVRPIEPDNKTQVGFIVTTTDTKEKRGTVLAKGKLAEDVEVGDVAVYGHYNPIEISLNGEKLIVMKESDIYGIIE